MNKKGYEFFEIPMWIIRMLYAIIVMVTVIFIVSYFIVMEVNVQRVDTYVTANLLYYSPAGLAYYDTDLERTLPGLVDESQLTANLQDIELGNINIIGARASITDSSLATDIISILNADTFQRLNWLTEAGLTSNKGGPDKVVLYYQVLLQNSQGVKSKVLKTETVTAST